MSQGKGKAVIGEAPPAFSTRMDDEEREPETVLPLDKETKDPEPSQQNIVSKPTDFEQQELKRLRDLAIRYMTQREHYKKVAFGHEEELAHAKYQNEQLQTEKDFEQQELERLRDLAIRYKTQREYYKKAALGHEGECAHAIYQNEQLQIESAGLEEQLATLEKDIQRNYHWSKQKMNPENTQKGPAANQMFIGTHPAMRAGDTTNISRVSNPRATISGNSNARFGPVAKKPDGWSGAWYDPVRNPEKIDADEKATMMRQGRCWGCRGSGHRGADPCCP